MPICAPLAAHIRQVGVSRLTLAEQRTHFALWALLKAPLIVGADLRHIHPDSLDILKAKEVINVNQDNLGVPGDLVCLCGSGVCEWGGRL